METLIAPAFNLAILLAVLFYYLKTPLKHFLQDRHNLIAKELEDVRSILRSAQEKYDEFSAKIKAVDTKNADRYILYLLAVLAIAAIPMSFSAVKSSLFEVVLPDNIFV